MLNKWGTPWIGFWSCLLSLGVFLLLFSFCKNAKITENEEKASISPEKGPGVGDSIVVIDEVKFVIRSYFWQDFMPMIPPQGPPFYLVFKLKVTNNTDRALIDFYAVKTNLFYEDDNEKFHSFSLIPAGGTKPKERILPKETKNFEYTNDRTEIFSPKIEEGTKLYGQILFSWDGKKQILTSSPSEVKYTH